MKEKPCVGSTFFSEFPSDCIPKVTKDVNVYFFSHSVPHATTPVNYTSEFQELFEATAYINPSVWNDGHCSS